MKKILLPVVMALVGVGGGVGAGLALAPAPGEDSAAAVCIPEGGAAMGGDTAGDARETDTTALVAAGGENAAPKDYVRMSNQFVVPVVEGGKVTALVVLSLSIEVTAGTQEATFSAEPKLRDAFLQVLFDHANIGGFNGAFTSSTNMRALRQALRAAGQKALGRQVSDVLIIDIVRQDI
mgnify:CR=1 FL=1